MSAHQLMRMLDLKSYRSAWFMAHRLRYAMMEGPMADLLSGVVEADETYIGAKKKRGASPRGGRVATSVQGEGLWYRIVTRPVLPS